MKRSGLLKLSLLGCAMLIGVAALEGLSATPAVASPALKGYIREIPPESAKAREARHRRITERRAGPIVIVHRGASAFAPENTLEAYAVAMDYGADGCEVDLRRTSDGVLVLFHDDMLDRLTEGFGAVRQITYPDLIRLKPRAIYGTAKADTRPPTLAALLVLARQRAMLLHLDIKEPELEDEIIALLDAADVWEHVVAVNDYNAAKVLAHPRLRLLRYKTFGLFEGRRDVDPEVVRMALAKPGEMIIVDDPRVAARELKRKPYQPVPLPQGLRILEPSDSGSVSDTNALNPAAFARSLSRRASFDTRESNERLTAILEADFPERNQPAGDAASERRRAERIIERAWAAQRLGARSDRSSGLDRVLEQQVINRSLHRDWIYHGLDGAMAARALGARGAAQSALVLIEAFRRVDPELKKVADPRWAQHPSSWADFHFKMHLLPALGELRCDASKEFLFEYVAMDAANARALSPPMFEEAARALLRQNLSRDELERLLQSTNTAVRGTAILECVDHPTRERTAALRAAAPWALNLPRARQ